MKVTFGGIVAGVGGIACGLIVSLTQARTGETLDGTPFLEIVPPFVDKGGYVIFCEPVYPYPWQLYIGAPDQMAVDYTSQSELIDTAFEAICDRRHLGQ